MRSFAEEAFRDAIPRRLPHGSGAIGSSGTINAIVAAHGDARRMTLRSVGRAVESSPGSRSPSGAHGSSRAARRSSSRAP